MTRQEFIDQIPEYILGRLDDDQLEKFLQYLSENPEMQSELDSWSDLKNIPHIEQFSPSKKMDHVFYAALKEEMEVKKELETADKRDVSRSLFPAKNASQWITRLAIAASLLFIGLLLGRQISQQDNIEPQNQIVDQVNQSELDDVRSQLVVSLAGEPYATKRLQAISEAEKMSAATSQVIQALFKMLNDDPNVNVRLAAVISLSNYIDDPVVREGLVMSITEQESPMVQIALADLMVTLKEKKSVRSLEELLQKPNTNDVVKQKLEESIKQII